MLGFGAQHKITIIYGNVKDIKKQNPPRAGRVLHTSISRGLFNNKFYCFVLLALSIMNSTEVNTFA